MTDYTLKFKDEAEALAVLESYEGSVDVIGVIYVPDGTFGEKDAPNMKPIEGYHVNIRGEENEAIAKYAIDVLTPVRVWA